MVVARCIVCSIEYAIDEMPHLCSKCGNLLTLSYESQEVERALQTGNWRSEPLGVWRYKPFLPIRDNEKIISLNEGGTSLYRCKRLAAAIGLKHLYVKNEGENPTGSFKDRGMTVGVSRAVELQAKIVVCASTGNTSASLAAYAARAAIRSLVLVPSGAVAGGKLAQAIIHGAKIVQVKGDFDKAFQLVLELSKRRRDVYLLNSINPYRIEGQKTLAFEVTEQLEEIRADILAVPVGNAGNISAIWKGYKEFEAFSLVKQPPRIFGIQAEGAAPIVAAVKSGREAIVPVTSPETAATAIRVGQPVSWKKALAAIKESKGGAETVNDNEIARAQRLLAETEGLFVEPASAASIAGVTKMVEEGAIDRDEIVVCVATGHGLKDPRFVSDRYFEKHEATSDIDAITKLIDQSFK